MAETTTKERTRSEELDASFNETFAQEAPEAQLPAAIQQVMIDDRPQGAMKVSVKRDIREVMKNIRAEATAAGDDFFYAWPTKNKDGTRGEVSGASVKCANAVSRIFGNCTVKIRAFDQGPHWIFYAQFYDMETGYVYERPFQQRKGQNIGGKMDKDRATDIVFQIGVSKAARNVVCNALSTFTDYAFDVAREQLVEKIGKNLASYLTRITKRLAELDVDVKRVEAVRGKPMDKFNASDAAKTIAEIQGITDGMTHPEELWPVIDTTGAASGSRPAMSEAEFVDDRSDEQKAADRAAKFPDPKTAEDMKALIAAREKLKAERTADTAKASGKATEGKKPEPAADAGKAKPSEPATPAADEQPDPGTADKPAATTAETTTGESAADGDAEADEKRAHAFELAERRLEELNEDHEGLPGCKTVDEVEQLQQAVKGTLEAREDLDPEDKAIILGRWATMCAERKRALSRRKPK